VGFQPFNLCNLIGHWKIGLVFSPFGRVLSCHWAWKISGTWQPCLCKSQWLFRSRIRTKSH